MQVLDVTPVPVSLAWEEPLNDGGSNIIGYHVEAKEVAANKQWMLLIRRRVLVVVDVGDFRKSLQRRSTARVSPETDGEVASPLGEPVRWLAGPLLLLRRLLPPFWIALAGRHPQHVPFWAVDWRRQAGRGRPDKQRRLRHPARVVQWGRGLDVHRLVLVDLVDRRQEMGRGVPARVQRIIRQRLRVRRVSGPADQILNQNNTSPVNT